MAQSPYPRYALVAAAVIAALALVLALFPWHVLRGPLASYASHRMHRDVTIGNLDVALGRITRLQLDDLSIGNVPGSADPRMAQASRLVLFFSLGSLLKGEPDYMQLVEPDVLLERNAEGAANWHFDDGGISLWPEVTAIDVDRGTVRYRDPALRADLSMGRSYSLIPSIRGVIDAIHGRNRAELERVHTFQTPDVVSVLVRIRAPLMVRVDSAVATEIVLRRARIELVQRERVGTLDNA